MLSMVTEERTISLSNAGVVSVALPSRSAPVFG